MQTVLNWISEHRGGITTLVYGVLTIALLKGWIRPEEQEQITGFLDKAAVEAAAVVMTGLQGYRWIANKAEKK